MDIIKGEAKRNLTNGLKSLAGIPTASNSISIIYPF